MAERRLQMLRRAMFIALTAFLVQIPAFASDQEPPPADGEQADPELAAIALLLMVAETMEEVNQIPVSVSAVAESGPTDISGVETIAEIQSPSSDATLSSMGGHDPAYSDRPPQTTQSLSVTPPEPPISVIPPEPPISVIPPEPPVEVIPLEPPITEVPDEVLSGPRITPSVPTASMIPDTLPITGERSVELWLLALTGLFLGTMLVALARPRRQAYRYWPGPAAGVRLRLHRLLAAPRT